MGRKELLQKRLGKFEKKKNDLVARSNASNSADEVRSINDQLVELNEDIQDIKDELSVLENEKKEETKQEQRDFSPLANYGQKRDQVEERSDDVLSSMEYRKAFMNHVQKGTPLPHEFRAGGDAGVTTTHDIGMIVPQTIMNEFIKDVSKVYGHIYSKVRKLNIPGGVTFPISSLKANFKWITETSTSDKQKAGDIKDKITFSYHMGEIRVAQTLLSQIVSLSLFESEIVRIIVETYVEAMDKAIISGTGDADNQPLWITNDPRVKNTVKFTDAEFSDWTAWRKKLFATIPLSKRGQGEFLFTASTVGTYLLTMQDANKRPLFNEATDLSMGSTAGKFFGRTCDLVEPDVIGDFATAQKDDIVGIFWVPQDYVINIQLQFGIKRYQDDDTNEIITKALTVVDGKIIDPSGCYLIKKA